MLNNFTSFDKWLWLLLLNIGGGTPATTLTVTGVSPLSLVNAVAHSMVSLTQYGKCVQEAGATPSTPKAIYCNNGVLTKPHDTYTAVDGQGTYASPGAAANRIYKAFNVGDGNYTISVPTAYDFIVQYKTPADGSTPTDSGNITSWVNGYTTVTLDKGMAYGYGIALRDHVNQSGNISPSDFSGTIVVVHDDEPVKAVGTPETLTVRGENLYNKTDGVVPGYPTASNTWAARSSTNGELSIMVKLEEGKTYTATRTSGAASVFRIQASATQTLTNGQQLTEIDNTGTATIDTKTFTVPVGAPYVLFYVRNNSNTSLTVDEVINGFMVERGSTATPYEPYVTPQTVNDVPMLLGVGDYKDEAELIAGIKTGKVGVKVFDGTETWTKRTDRDTTYQVNGISGKPSGVVAGLCSHFNIVTAYSSLNDGCGLMDATDRFVATYSRCADVTEFKAFLAAQYAAGTPVIVIYPLAAETTEQTTPHSLHTAQGTNTVSVTAEVSDISLTAEYKGVSS